MGCSSIIIINIDEYSITPWLVNYLRRGSMINVYGILLTFWKVPVVVTNAKSVYGPIIVVRS